MYEYQGRLDRVIDGDTLKAWIDLGFSTWVLQTFRLVGIDAPEVRGSKRIQGKASKLHLEDLCERLKPLTFHTVQDKTGKYGRYLITIYGNDATGPVNINDRMVQDRQALQRDK